MASEPDAVRRARELRDLLAEYRRAPGRYNAAARQPPLLFASMREVLQLAIGRDDGAGPDGEARRAACFFVRSALLHPAANHYELLGLDRRAEAAAIKDRYRLMMRLLHPDFAAPGDPWPAASAARVNQAYEVLSSPVRRREYDETLATPAAPPPRPARPEPPAPAPVAYPLVRRPLSLRHTSRRGLKMLIIGCAGLGGLGLVLALMPGPADHEVLVQRLPREVPPGPPAAPSKPAAPTETPAVVLAETALRLPDADTGTPAAMPPPAVLAAAAATPLPPPPMAGAMPPVPVPARPALRAASVVAAPVLGAAAAPAPAPLAVPVASPLPTPASAPLAAPVPLTPVTPVVPVAAVPPAPPPAAEEPARAAATRLAVGRVTEPPAPAPPPAARPAGLTLTEAQPMLAALLHGIEAARGDQVLGLLDRDARQSTSAQSLSRHIDGLAAHGPVRVASVQFSAEPGDGRLRVLGQMRLEGGAAPRRLVLRMEFVSRGGTPVMTALSGEASP
jgi:DnaJ-domain-containing protein 1